MATVDTSFVTDIIALQTQVAADRMVKADDYTSSALAESHSLSWANGVSIAQGIVIPEPPALDGMSSAEMANLYQGTSDQITSLLANALNNFFSTFFPLGTELANAQAWINKALTTGGTGLAPAIEDQIWQRDRARILKDAMRASNEAAGKWAARGFPLPPGALVGQVASIEQDARDKIAESSRSRAIESAKMELDNIKFAVDKAISMRVEAIRASGDYIRTVALGPQLGTQLATSTAQTKIGFAESLTRLYAAEISALELPVRINIEQGRLDMQQQTANLEGFIKMAQVRTNTVMAAAQSVGSQASAALNALSTNASVSLQTNN